MFSGRVVVGDNAASFLRNQALLTRLRIRFRPPHCGFVCAFHRVLIYDRINVAFIAGAGAVTEQFLPARARLNCLVVLCSTSARPRRSTLGTAAIRIARRKSWPLRSIRIIHVCNSCLLGSKNLGAYGCRGCNVV